MNKTEVVACLAYLKTNYAQFYRDQPREALEGMVSTWCDMFEDAEFVQVQAACKAFIATDVKGFPPSIGQINQFVAKMRGGKEMTEVEAWGYVSRACKNATYGAQEEFDRLPPLVRQVVRSPSVLREWAMLDQATFQTVTASNFMRSFRGTSASAREYLALPQSVRGMLNASVTDGLSLAEGTDMGISEKAKNTALNAFREAVQNER